MQWLGIFIFSLFGYGIKELAVRALAGVGFGLVTTYGLFALFGQLSSYVSSSFSGLPSDVLAFMGLMRIDSAFSVILSAATAKQVILGWNKFTDRRSNRVWHPPGSGGGGTLGA